MEVVGTKFVKYTTIHVLGNGISNKLLLLSKFKHAHVKGVD